MLPFRSISAHFQRADRKLESVVLIYLQSNRTWLGDAKRAAALNYVTRDT